MCQVNMSEGIKKKMLKGCEKMLKEKIEKFHPLMLKKFDENFWLDFSYNA